MKKTIIITVGILAVIGLLSIASNSTPTASNGLVYPVLPTRPPNTSPDGRVDVVGIPAIKPSIAAAIQAGNSPTFTEADVRAYIDNAQMLSALNSTTPTSIASVEFLNNQQLAAWIKAASTESYPGYTKPDNGLMSVVKLKGDFTPLGSPPGSTPPPGYVPKTYKHGFIIFDAKTGNYLAQGAF